MQREVAGKLSAVYSRGEVRDFLDLDAIRGSGRFTDAGLLALGREHDDGFESGMFAAQLSRVTVFLPSEAAKYGVAADDFTAAQQRLLEWATELRDTLERAPDAPGSQHAQPRGSEQNRPTPPPTSDRRTGRRGPSDTPSGPRRDRRPGPEHDGPGI